ncbi:MAG: hypothetical protein D6758_13785 [Gammaproteobacteria bacterium]|nr:MAG: hypothetical protein D6758_13785 [Gammaproteobacteria bacterium]
MGVAAVALAQADGGIPSAWVSQDGSQRLICTEGGWLWYGQTQAGHTRYRFAARGDGSACARSRTQRIHFESIQLYPAGQVISGQDAIAGHTSELPAEQTLNAVLELRLQKDPPRMHCASGTLCQFMRESFELERAP